jgi:hypothetical protein
MERSFPRPLDLYRRRFQPGQMLRGRDFRTQLGDEAQLRWWHNRALHNAYGVVQGLTWEVTWEATNGTPPTATVQPGLAYDAFGRELLLPAPVTLSIPSDDPCQLTLVARYPCEPACAEEGDIAAACLPATRPATEPPFTLVWKRNGDIHVRDGVQLLNASPECAKEVQSDETWTGGSSAHLTSAPIRGRGGRPVIWDPPRDGDGIAAKSVRSAAATSAQRKVLPMCAPATAKPLSGPRVAHGSTIPGSAWDIWTIDIVTSEASDGGRGRVDTPVTGLVPLPVGIQVGVDTSAAGFTEVPCYFAWLHWPSTKNLDTALMPALATAIPYVTESVNDGFVFRLLQPDAAVIATKRKAEGLRAQQAAAQRAAPRDGPREATALIEAAAARPDAAAAAAAAVPSELQGNPLTVPIALAISTREMLAFVEEARPSLCWVAIEDDCGRNCCAEAW